MAITQEYQAFNEENPWGRGATVVTEDNVQASRIRDQAIIAVKARTATPEQYALVAETDAAMQYAMRDGKSETASKNPHDVIGPQAGPQPVIRL